MSYEIDYRQKAYFTNGEDKSEVDYLVLHETGSNNCYEGRKRARDWDIMAFGWLYLVWHKVTQWVGATAGHCLEIKGLKPLDINEYNHMVKYYENLTQKGLKKYTYLIKNAKPLEKIFDDFHQISIYIALEDKKDGQKKYMQLKDIESKYYRDRLKNYLTNYKLKLKKGKDFYGYKQLTVRMEIKTVKDLLEAIAMKRYDSGIQFGIVFSERYGLSMD